MNELPPTVSERIAPILEELKSLGREPIPEKVVWDAIRAAYALGYDDGGEVRAVGDEAVI